jgi:hypothetical protein
MNELSRALTRQILDRTGVYPMRSNPRQVRVATALRRLVDAAVDPALDRSDDLAERLEAVVAQLPARATASRFGRRRVESCVPSFPMGTHPVIGEANPLAPPLQVDLIDDDVVGEACYGAAFEGLPGSVYGGFIAATFDAVLGIRAALEGTPCSATSLATRFLEPTPLHVPLTYRIWLRAVDGRKLFVEGALATPSGTVTAEADAVFLAIGVGDVTTEHP